MCGCLVDFIRFSFVIILSGIIFLFSPSILFAAEDTIVISLIVGECEKNASIVDGNDFYAAYDATLAKIIFPHNYVGRDVEIFHQINPVVPFEVSKMWCRQGAFIMFTIPSDAFLRGMEQKEFYDALVIYRDAINVVKPEGE